MPKIASGKRLHLRTVDKKDAKRVAALANDKRINRFTFMPYPYKIRHFHSFLKRIGNKSKKKNGYAFAIVLKETDEIIGMMGIHDLNKVHKSATIGYWLARGYRKKGYGTEALSLLLRHAFCRMGLERLSAGVFRGNPASAGLLKRCGFRFEGISRGRYIKNNKRIDAQEFAILKSDYERKAKSTNG